MHCVSILSLAVICRADSPVPVSVRHQFQLHHGPVQVSADTVHHSTRKGCHTCHERKVKYVPNHDLDRSHGQVTVGEGDGE
ncbi:hypothetical protein CLAFUW4_20084 [Fulvia fulva]|uniref:uncharacterized protein n=1 Tax=Passalora fulva TaxID=5499 RepID=UPI0028527024|nr:uncharacterized protein CLAFUR5_20084 [Fulvia fulva]KAK4614023.1 hypothetical protein CLAFUR4_20084 [Fulvia fulva]KAK4614770.1 hypothetical protein CLAFUR0_20084 [Fulvia fulva]WMI39015.1 hypothetical protein CLAFUR5_20084 [Fulvia fulva]WPV19805.1 hypothetical protein CLAFUW4_20084 [Fulvia fulva]WPV35466.1 hypothetical protein CLAFUW7_20084 [Fulvia fulva]